jgi:hypothetical protein
MLGLRGLPQVFLLLKFFVFPGSPATTSMSREISMSAWTSLVCSNPNSGAASDRQDLRDLFDVMLLQQAAGI